MQEINKNNSFEEYDLLADVYDLWCQGDSAFNESHEFYVNLASEFKGVIAEVGVGTGRIAIDIAKKGKNIIGIDVSSKMLEKFKEKILKENVSSNITLIQDSAKSFTLSSPAELIYFPFRSFGHLLSDVERIKFLLNIKKQLAPKGVLVFDHYIFDEDWAKKNERIPRLMYSGSTKGKNKVFVWDTYSYDFSKQIMNCIITVEYTDTNFNVISKQHCPLTFSWVTVEQVRRLLEKAGYKIVKLLGSFNGEEFKKHSTEQIWMVQPNEK